LQLKDDNNFNIEINFHGNSMVVVYTGDNGKAESVLVPGVEMCADVWYQAAIAFVKPKYLLYSTDELRVSIDSRLVLQRSVRFYRYPKELSKNELHLEIGRKFVGEMGPILIFSEILGQVAADAVSRFSSGNQSGVKGPGVYNLDLERDVTALSSDNRNTLHLLAVPLAIPNPLVRSTPTVPKAAIALNPNRYCTCVV
jgi:hypothetical protein